MSEKPPSMILADSRLYAPLFLWVGLAGLEANLLQQFGLALQLGLPRGKFIEAENVGENINFLLPAHLHGITLRHGSTNAFIQIAQRQAIPIGQEGCTCQRLRFSATLQGFAVTGRASFSIERLASSGLLLGVNTIPHRARIRISRIR